MSIEHAGAERVHPGAEPEPAAAGAEPVAAGAEPAAAGADSAAVDPSAADAGAWTDPIAAIRAFADSLVYIPPESLSQSHVMWLERESMKMMHRELDLQRREKECADLHAQRTKTFYGRGKGAGKGHSPWKHRNRRNAPPADAPTP